MMRKTIDNFSIFDELFSQNRFFELRDEIAGYVGDNSPEILFYRGVAANKFNRTQESIELLDRYLKAAKPNGRRLCECFELLGDNYAKFYQYKNAGEKFAWVSENCGNHYSEYERQDVNFSYKIWNAVRDIPPQKIAFDADTRLEFSRSRMKLIEIPVEFNEQKIDFVLDTGASISCITAPTAEKMDLQIIAADISVGTGTDIRLNADIGIASEMRIGNVRLENVVFLVFQEEALYFEKFDYQINGIIGYPVLQACRRFSVLTQGELFIPANYAAQNTEQNLCFDHFTPLLNIDFKGNPMSFIFDTGGRRVQFWSRFFESQESEIKNNATMNQTKLLAAGGETKSSAYILDKLQFPFFGRNIKLNNVRIIDKPINYIMEKYFGIMGQEFMMQFEKMTIDFHLPSIIFE